MTAPLALGHRSDTAVAMTDDELFAQFRLYAGQGVPCLVVQLKLLANGKIDKKPATRNGHHDATTRLNLFMDQLGDVRATLGNDAVLAIGLHLGPANLGVLDFDKKGGANGLELLAELTEKHAELADMPRFRSPSGGMNLPFVKPAGQAVGNGKYMGRDVDVRADSGWVVAPGTTSPWGSWEWLNNATLSDAVRLPAAMEEALPKPGSSGVRKVKRAEVQAFLDAQTCATVFLQRERLAGHVAAIAKAGNRHGTLISAVGWLCASAQVDRPEAFAAIDDAWRQRMKQDGEKGRDDEAWSATAYAVGGEETKRKERAAREEQMDDRAAAATARGKGEVDMTDKYLDEIADEVVDVLVQGNNPPLLFAYGEGSALLELANGELQMLDPDRTLDLIERRMRTFKVTRQGAKPSTVTVDARKLVLLRLSVRLPKLVGLAVTPFMRPDGSICSTVGYDEGTEMYLLNDVGVEVPHEPTPDDIKAARDLLLELFVDFPFLDLASRANAISAIITPAIRRLVPLVPMHAVNGNKSGVGKNLLVESAVAVHSGEPPELAALSSSEEEMRKTITAILLTGRPIVVWDESELVIGKQLTRLLTSRTWSDRMLGGNQQLRLQNRVTMYAMGNGMEIARDLRRRVVVIELQTALTNPGSRGGFLHDDLERWVLDNRPRLLSAILTLLRGWHCAGRPTAGHRMGSFQQWADCIGGTLGLAGIDGFLDNAKIVMTSADPREQEFAEYLLVIEETFGLGTLVTVKGLLDSHRSQLLGSLGGDELPLDVDPYDRTAGDLLGKRFKQYKNTPLECGTDENGEPIVRKAVQVNRTGRDGRGWAVVEVEELQALE